MSARFFILAWALAGAIVSCVLLALSKWYTYEFGSIAESVNLVGFCLYFVAWPGWIPYSMLEAASAGSHRGEIWSFLFWASTNVFLYALIGASLWYGKHKDNRYYMISISVFALLAMAILSMLAPLAIGVMLH